MSSVSPAGEIFSLKSQIEKLVEEWGEQVKEFRRLSLIAEGYTEETRMRAKADTLNYSRNELMMALEELQDQETASSGKNAWPGLNGIVNSGKGS